MDNYIIISHIPGGYRIRAEYNGSRFCSMNYYGYSKREAEKRYRAQHELQYKKFIRVEW